MWPFKSKHLSFEKISSNKIEELINTYKQKLDEDLERVAWHEKMKDQYNNSVIDGQSLIHALNVQLRNMRGNS